MRSTRRTIAPSSVAGGGARPEWRRIPSRTASVRLRRLDHVDHPQRVLVVAEAGPEALAQARVQRRLADVAERRVAEVVAQPDRLGQVLVEAQRPRHGPRDLRDLERVGEPRAVVIALGRDEHLRLVLEAPERLGVDDPVAVALEGRAQRAVLLRTLADRRVGAGGQVGQVLVLPRPDPGLEFRGHGGRMGDLLPHADCRSVHGPADGPCQTRARYVGEPATSARVRSRAPTVATYRSWPSSPPKATLATKSAGTSITSTSAPSGA